MNCWGILKVFYLYFYPCKQFCKLKVVIICNPNTMIGMDSMKAQIFSVIFALAYGMEASKNWKSCNIKPFGVSFHYSLVTIGFSLFIQWSTAHVNLAYAYFLLSDLLSIVLCVIAVFLTIFVEARVWYLYFWIMHDLTLFVYLG